jgi:uncharacterized YccA/Bax inhibitor family protein
MATATLETGNPAFRADSFRQARGEGLSTGAMTIQGAAVKTLILVGILLAAAAFTWSQCLHAVTGEFSGQTVTRFEPNSSVYAFLMIGLIGGFIVSLITIFSPRSSPVTAPLYAGLEGLALGGISAMFEYRYPGIVLNAVGLTVGTLVVMLFAYASGVLRATPKFTIGVIAATGAVCLVYFVDLILGFFGIHVPFVNDNGPIGIAISGVIVVIAALNLILDFGQVERGAAYGAPKYMEWYCGFGLLVTLVWLYLEILRLLAKLQSRRD